MRCRTKTGTLKLYYEGEHYLLDGNGIDLPDALAESIRSHVNVIVGSETPNPDAAELEPEEDRRTHRQRKRADE